MRWPSIDSSRSRRAATSASASATSGASSGDRGELGAGEVVADGGRQHEVAVGQALHQRRGAEPVRAVVGEVRLADHEQARDGALQVVVDPQPAHRVVHGRVDAHRDLVGVLAGDALVHVEEVAVLRRHGRPAEALDRGGEVEVDAQAGRADAALGVADGLRGAAGDVARDQVAERRVLALEEVVALVLGDVARVAVVAHLLGHPHAAVVAQRLAHQRQLRLVVAADGDAGGVDLGVAGVGEQRALAVRPPGGGDVAALGVGREVEDVAVAAGGEHDGVGQVAAGLAGHQVAGDDAAGAAVDDDQLEHLVPVVHRDGAGLDLALERLVGAEQQLLAGLAAGVEGARDLGAAEGAGVEQAAVLAGERDTLRHALVDDLAADLGEPVHVGLPRAEVAALDRVVEQPEDAVAVVAVVLRGVDAALGGDRVGAARAVLEAERADLVAQLAQRRRRGAAGEAGAHHDDLHLALVGRVHQLHAEAAALPAGVDRTAGGRGVGDRLTHRVVDIVRHRTPTNPNWTAKGTARKPAVRTTANTSAIAL